jgi:MazG family protein
MGKRYAFQDLVRIMARLRKGCPWDREQTHQSLLRYLREESREVVQAVHKKDHRNLCEELGDLLHQVMFHAELAREKGRFTIHDVVDGLCRKMVRRHPHVFGKKKLRTSEEVMVQWKEIKRKEKKKGAPWK